MNEIGLKELFSILRNGLRKIILLMLLSILLTGIFSFFIFKPKYEASTTLMAGKPRKSQFPSGIEYDDLMINEKLVHTYAKLIESRDVGNKVIENLDLNINFKTFSNKMKVNLVEETEIIKITAQDSDPTIASRIANETASVFMDSVVRFMNIDNIQIIDEAQVPDKPIRPRPILNMVIGGVLGIMIGVFITFLLEFSNQTIKTPEDVEKYLELSNLGVIPKISDGKIRLVSFIGSESFITEDFRSLRINIQLSNVDKELQTLVITSSTYGEGKSTIAINIAGTVAQENKKVLIIDCNLRRPRIHEICKIENSDGLTNILTGNKTHDEVTFMYRGLENLHIIPAGQIPPNPEKLLSSNKMKEFIKEMKDEYDMVVLDSPSIGVFIDSAIMSTMADGVILVAAAAETRVEDIVRSKELLNKVYANIVGTVLNKVPIENKDQYEHGYYENYLTMRKV